MLRLPQWARSPFFLVGVSFVLVTVVGYALDRLLLDTGLSRWHTILFSNAVTGAIAALFLAYRQQQHRRELELMQQRVQIVGDMNHHIRNALQVIVYFAQNAKDRESADRLRDSIDRIQWALREVLPRYTPTEDEDVRHIN
jgi:signal transduction histidine kinase